MYMEGQIDSLILGGTELPLMLKSSDMEDIELLNTTKIMSSEFWMLLSADQIHCILYPQSMTAC